jgi:hypothetical protein
MNRTQRDGFSRRTHATGAGITEGRLAVEIDPSGELLHRSI